MPLHFSGVVLAAGRSRRMGSDKALLEIDGKPAWRRQRDLLRAAGAAAVYLSARPEQAWSGRAEGFAAVLRDQTPDCGPIMGLSAALERMATPHLAVLAIDLPTMSPGWFETLAGACADGRGAVGRRSAGFFEPLAAIYPKAAMWRTWEAIARGEYGLQSLLRALVAERAMAVIEIEAAQEALFTNRNDVPAG